MVGVPGRSKGCTTCRTRKKGCDLKRPTCGQCEARGIVCGGYESDRIFVHHSAASKHGVIRPTPNVAARRVISDPSRKRSKHSFAFHVSEIENVDIILPDNLTRSAYREKSVEAFFSMYAPNIINNSTRTGIHGFAEALSRLYTQDEALRLVLLALGTAMLGRKGGDEPMIRQGRKLYGKGLEEMGMALKDEKRMKSEALFAVPRVGAMFEMFFGADPNPNLQARSWMSHASGGQAMVIALGPEAHRDSDILHQLFVDGRWRAIIAAMWRRKATPLNNDEWKTVPWGKRPKTPKDLLLDILVSLPGVLEDVDRLSDDPRNLVLRAEIVKECRRVEKELTFWATRYEDLIYRPWIDSVPLTFSSLTVAYMTVVYWTTSLILHEALEASLSEASPAPASRSGSRKFARSIALAVPYFFQESCGLWGAMTIAFPMAMSLMSLKRSSEAEDKRFLRVMVDAWTDPNIPSLIRDFLRSMRREAASVWLNKGWSRERVEAMFQEKVVPQQSR